MRACLFERNPGAGQGSTSSISLRIRLYFKCELKDSRAIFFSSQTLLADQTRRKPLERLVFNFRAIECLGCFTSFHLFRYLNRYTFSKIVPKHFLFRYTFREKKSIWRSSFRFQNWILALWWCHKQTRHCVYVLESFQWMTGITFGIPEKSTYNCD